MNINGFILAEEMTGLEQVCLKSDILDLPLTQALVWQKGIRFQSHYAYILSADDLTAIPQEHPPLTLISIGRPGDSFFNDPGLSILSVKAFLSPHILLSMLLKIFEKYKGYSENLETLCQQKATPAKLAPSLLDMFGNPLLLLGKQMEILAAFEDQETCRLPFACREADTDFPVPGLLDDIRESLEKEKKNPGQVYHTREGLPFLLCPADPQKGASLALCLFCVTASPGPQHRILLEHTVRYLENLYRATRFNAYQGMSCLQAALSRYLELGVSCPLSTVRCLERTLQALSWGLRDTYVCLVLKSAFFKKLREQDLPAASLFTRQSLMINQGTEIFFICNVSLLPCPLEQTVHDLTQIFHDSLFIAGISTAFRNFLDFPDYCVQAQAALRIGTKLDYARRVYPFLEFALDYIIYEGWSSLPMSVLLYGGLKDMLMHDYIHQTQYCQTLKSLFDNYMTMSRTGTQLGIHISTLKYRLGRIHEMLGLDLNDTYSKMYLQVVLFELSQHRQELDGYLEKEVLRQQSYEKSKLH